MEAAKGILVFLATVFVAADCSFRFGEYVDFLGYHGWFNYYSENEDNDTSPYTCEERLDMCWPTMHSESILSDLARDMYTVVGSIDQICIDQASDCFRPFLNRCHNYTREYIDVLVSSGEYLCSERGRELMEGASNSPCYSDKVRLGFISELTWRNCILLPEIEEGADNNECQLLARRRHCESIAATEECGPAVGTLFRELRTREDAVYFPHCSANSSSMAEARNSSCYFDEEQFRAIRELANNCSYSSHDDQEYGANYFCQATDRRTHCLIQAATQQCGQAFGTFVRELTNTIDLFPECSLDSS